MKFKDLFTGISNLRFAGRTAAGFGATVFFCGSSAQAALLFYEPFNYAAGSNLVGQGGWVSSGTSTPVIGSVGSTYTDSNGKVLPASGNSANLTADGAFIPLGNTYGGANGGIYYVSFLAQSSNIAAGNYFFLSPATNGNPTTDFGKPNSNTSLTWTVRSSANLPGYPVSAVSNASLTDLSLIVLRLDFTGATNAVFHMWVNPDLGAEPALLDADAAGTRATVSFNGFRIQGTADGTFDEIRFGTSYANVIPEPSSFALTLLGGGFLLRRKRPAIR